MFFPQVGLLANAVARLFEARIGAACAAHLW
jgi:hypothetical protein